MKLETPPGVREVGLGDQLLVEGDLKEQTVLIVKRAIRANMCYTFTAGEYEKTGEAGKPRQNSLYEIGEISRPCGTGVSH
jgi:hypothetical protein